MLGPLQMVPQVLPSRLQPREATMSSSKLVDTSLKTSISPEGTNSGSVFRMARKKIKEYVVIVIIVA